MSALMDEEIKHKTALERVMNLIVRPEQPASH